MLAVLDDHATATDPTGATAQESRHSPLSRAYRFGPFLLQPERQLLTKDSLPVRIGGRALDMLTVLVERPGELVPKRELLSRVWPQTFVDETNLRANMAILRRALGESHAGIPRFIATVVGRGYRFVSPVHAWGIDGSAAHPDGTAPAYPAI